MASQLHDFLHIYLNTESTGEISVGEFASFRPSTSTKIVKHGDVVLLDDKCELPVPWAIISNLYRVQAGTNSYEVAYVEVLKPVSSDGKWIDSTTHALHLRPHQAKSVRLPRSSTPRRALLLVLSIGISPGVRSSTQSSIKMQFAQDNQNYLNIIY